MTHPLLAARYRLTLTDGREIELATYYQQPTYLSLLWGTPTRSMNRDIMQSHLRMAEERQCRLSLALVPARLEPVVAPTPFGLRRGGLEEDILNPYEALPPVLSVAVFDSSAAGSAEACSSALVVWYQEKWGLPTPPVLESLRKLDWTTHARDWTW